MTGTYEWNPMPHQLDVRCPSCGHRAEFEFAEVVAIRLKSDVAFFQNSSALEYRQFQDSCGHLWHGAVYFEGLHGSPRQALHDLPPGYAPEDWEHSRYLRGTQSLREGSLRCGRCHARAQHGLNWPDDAYYSVAYRGKILWAYHRENAVELLDYLQSKRRDISRYRWSSFLLHLPTLFKSHKARDTIVKQLQKLLNPDTKSIVTGIR